MEEPLSSPQSGEAALENQASPNIVKVATVGEVLDSIQEKLEKLREYEVDRFMVAVWVEDSTTLELTRYSWQFNVTSHELAIRLLTKNLDDLKRVLDAERTRVIPLRPRFLEQEEPGGQNSNEGAQETPQ